MIKHNHKVDRYGGGRADCLRCRVAEAAPAMFELLQSAIRGLDTDGPASASAVLNSAGRDLLAKLERKEA